jgi:hypothetical protein
MKTIDSCRAPEIFDHVGSSIALEERQIIARETIEASPEKFKKLFKAKKDADLRGEIYGPCINDSCIACEETGTISKGWCKDCYRLYEREYSNNGDESKKIYNELKKKIDKGDTLYFFEDEFSSPQRHIK